VRFGIIVRLWRALAYFLHILSRTHMQGRMPQIALTLDMIVMNGRLGSDCFDGLQVAAVPRHEPHDRCTAGTRLEASAKLRTEICDFGLETGSGSAKVISAIGNQRQQRTTGKLQHRTTILL
jgi:hypothetical protein